VAWLLYFINWNMTLNVHLS